MNGIVDWFVTTLNAITDFLQSILGTDGPAFALIGAIGDSALAAFIPTLFLALFVLTINIVLRRKLTATQKCWLWMLVLLRMLVPAGPQSALSLSTAGEWIASLQPPPAAAENIVITPDFDAPLETWIETNGFRVPPNRIDPPFRRSWNDFGIQLLSPFFLVALFGIPIWTVYSHWRFVRRVSRLSPSTDARLIAIWNSCRAEGRVAAHIPIILTDTVPQPAILGFTQPLLLLPTSSSALTDDQLRMVMLHELAHVKRWDVLANWCLLFVRTFCWWNPVYWLADARYRSLREQACDAFVLSKLPSNLRRAYGELLISLADAGSQPRSRMLLPATLLGLWPTRLRTLALRTRLQALPHAAAGTSTWQRCVAIVLIGLIGWAGFTSAQEVVDQKSLGEAEKVLQWQALDDQPIPTWPATEVQPVEVGGAGTHNGEFNYVITYDLRSALDEITLRRKFRSDAFRIVNAQLRNLQVVVNVSLPAIDVVDLNGLQPEPTSNGFIATWHGEDLILKASREVHDKFASMVKEWRVSGDAGLLDEAKSNAVNIDSPPESTRRIESPILRNSGSSERGFTEYLKSANERFIKETYQLKDAIDGIARWTENRDRAYFIVSGRLSAEQVSERSEILADPVAEEADRKKSEAKREAYYVWDGDELTVFAPRKTHTKLNKIINGWTLGGDATIQLEVAWLRHRPHEYLPHLGNISELNAVQAKTALGKIEVVEDAVEGKPAVASEPAFSAFTSMKGKLLKPEEYVRFIQALPKTPENGFGGSQFLNGDGAYVSTMWKFPYCVGVRSNIRGTDRVHNDEVVTMHGNLESQVVEVRRGIQFSSRCWLMPDRESIQLSGAVEIDEVLEVSEQVRPNQSETFTLQIPTVHRRVINIARAVPVGQTLILLLPEYDRRDKVTAVALTARFLPQ